MAAMMILAAVMGAGWVWAEYRIDRREDERDALDVRLTASEDERLRWEAQARRLNVEVGRAQEHDRQRRRGVW